MHQRGAVALRVSETWLSRFWRDGRGMNPARTVALSFGLMVLAGTLLLMLPAASRNGTSAGGITALFTATSATCVTGLILADTWVQWSLFGQGVILAMIQLGGLGFMTVITLFSLSLHRRIGLSQRLVMVSALNLNNMDGVVRVVRHALMGTFLFEGAGALILWPCFAPRFGVLGGLWRGIFHAVSAFCNAGFDLMGAAEPGVGLALYRDHPVVLVTLMALIVVGGLGFFVWEDILRARRWKGLSLYSKMVLALTGALIAAGAAFFLAVEWDNPLTLGPMPVWEKGLNALFQSVTLRTAGFNTIDQAGLRDSAMAMSCIFMLVGGSSGSTAGGLKTVTVAVLLLTLRAGLRGREEVTLRGRSVSRRRVMDALTLTFTVLVLFFLSAMAISLADRVPFLPAAFEAASALATVGLTAGVTATLGVGSRVMLVALMFLGRVGIMSFSLAFLTQGRTPNKLKYPTFDIMIG